MKLDAKVVSILYGSIMNNEGTLIDISSHYQILNAVEKCASHTEDPNRWKDTILELQKQEIITQKEIRDFENINHIIKDSYYNLRSESLETIEEKTSQLEDMKQKQDSQTIAGTIVASRLEKIYYAYGFPFVCVDNAMNLHKDITEMYHRQVWSLCEELDVLFQKNQNEYCQQLDDYLKDDGKLLEERIPYIFEMDCWSVSFEYYPKVVFDEQKFAKELSLRLERVRLCRNAISHNLNNSYSSSQYQEDIAKEIRKWIAEYQIMF